MIASHEIDNPGALKALPTSPNKALPASLPLKCAQVRSVVVHSGARDGYQLALALAEVDMLDTLVTDLYWPADRWWARFASILLPNGIVRMLNQRGVSELPSKRVRQCALNGAVTLLLDKLPHAPFWLRRNATRRTDAMLGRIAGDLANGRGSALVTYSYYGYDAFIRYRGGGILFQLHPHPLSMRRILTEELEAHPECADSLRQEWELALSEEEFQRLVAETTMASHTLVASSFTRRTLVENGVREENVTVVPYGVDTERFKPWRDKRPREDGKLGLLFVGRINQRKGVKYLLEALRLLDTDRVHLTICGRVVDDLEIFKPFALQVTIRPSVSTEELIEAYQTADLFVFPSVAEGFGQVLLESLACGLPILSTTSTAAPDLIDDSVEGFVVEPRRADLLAQRIEWAVEHRFELAEMGVNARRKAEHFSWERFRKDVAAAVFAHQNSRSEETQSHD